MTSFVPGLEITAEEIPTVVMSSPQPPNIETEPPKTDEILFVPTPGPPGKNGAVVGAAQLTYKHEQVNPEVTWVITHPLVQEVSACHVVIAGEPIEVPWMETGDHEISIYFQGLSSGYAVIS